MAESTAVDFFVLLYAALDKQQELLVIGSPWRCVVVAIDKDILKGSKDFFGLGIASIGELVIDKVLNLVFVSDEFLDFVSVIDGIFEDFFHLGVVGVETYFALMGVLMCVDEQDDHSSMYAALNL
jgi:hypothetical protein